MQEEIWKPIPIKGYEEYLVSNMGNVYSPYNNRKLKIGPNSTGYNYIHLKDKHFRVARLVALAFIPNPKNLETVNHINEIRTDDRAENLEWMSRADNIVYSEGRKVRQLDLDGNVIAVYDSISALAKALGGTRSNLRCHYINKNKPYKGFLFETIS